MTNVSAAAVVRDFWESFGPTCDDAVATCRRLVHDVVAWESVLAEAKPVESLDDLVADLERARVELGAEGYHFEVKSSSSRTTSSSASGSNGSWTRTAGLSLSST
ncbi:hypothetical protein [Streptomyces sp. NPDC004324]